LKTSWLVTNYNCNNKCNYCYASGTQNQIMKLEHGKDILNRLKDMGVIQVILIGGEPTIYKDLFRIISYGINLGLKFKIVSNGRKLRNMAFLNNLIESGISHISISIEAELEEKHNEICGTTSFNETLKGLKNCVKLGISLNTVTTISSENKDKIYEIAKFLNNLGVKKILFNFGVPTVTTDVKNNSVFLSPKELAESAYLAYTKLKQENIKVRFFSTIPVCAYGENYEIMKNDGYISGGSSCHMFNGKGIVIEPSGQVIPCTHFVNKFLFNCIDQYNEVISLKDFKIKWYEKRKEIEEVLWKYPSVKCKECSIWGQCTGGCPLIWKVFDPEEHIYGL